MPYAAGFRQRFPDWRLFALHCLAVPLATLGSGITLFLDAVGFGVGKCVCSLTHGKRELYGAVAFFLDPSGPQSVLHPVEC